MEPERETSLLLPNWDDIPVDDEAEPLDAEVAHDGIPADREVQ